jgi:FKBP-type peptidyl-prolyl cis-trans isomerase SlpA
MPQRGPSRCARKIPEKRMKWHAWRLRQDGLSTISTNLVLLPADPGVGLKAFYMPTLQSSIDPVPSVAPPVVQPDSFLTLHYRMAAPGGASIINTFEGKPATLSLGNGELSPAIEQRLLGLPEGARATFQLAAGEAFGQRNPELVQWVARKLLNQFGDPDEQYSAGDVVQFPTPDGRGQYAGAVQQVRGGDAAAVQFDFNHPLAGQSVEFEVQVIGVL